MVMDSERLARLRAAGAADLVEIFSSIQGEGPRVGERHLFVRFAHCDIHCAYCDTPLCHATRDTFRMEEPLAGGTMVPRENPVPIDRLEVLVAAALDAIPHAAVSLTGGEPLLHPWAIPALSRVARARGVAVLLETDGNLADAFDEVAEQVDVLSLDWKLASATGEPARPDQHRRMLARAAERGTETLVKCVFVEESPDEEFIEAADAVAAVHPEAVLVLQPVTPFRKVRTAPSAARTAALSLLLAPRVRHLRVIPQVHKLLGQP